MRAHLALLRALYIFPAFPRALCETIGSGTDSLNDFLLGSRFFRKDLNYEETLQTFGATSMDPGFLLFVRRERQNLINAYAKQTQEFWSPLLGWVKQACIVLESLVVLEHLCHQKTSDGPSLPEPDLLKPALALAPFVHFPEVMGQYVGVRASEFAGQQPVLPDMLLHSAPECIETAAAIRRRDRPALQGLQRWWTEFRERTGTLNPNSNAGLLFLQTLLPWSRLDFTSNL
eukprot:Protomagalhaensia_wolfi_Nauph_80__6234@NODE_940_length_1863_cov_446_209430_g710_i0_p2_GENE_NODE_940_length_1863_cov_446_209430_g710_i0NODE_940_length_1863_cov_446_209430_g710_i0_p2_ORF_typecomplete_len231_score47_19Tcf25/PF04910_14/0_0004_NODE_940_length_1863_cov_446_209430_g710_i011691861